MAFATTAHGWPIYSYLMCLRTFSLWPIRIGLQQRILHYQPLVPAVHCGMALRHCSMSPAHRHSAQRPRGTMVPGRRPRRYLNCPAWQPSVRAPHGDTAANLAAMALQTGPAGVPPPHCYVAYAHLSDHSWTADGRPISPLLSAVASADAALELACCASAASLQVGHETAPIGAAQSVWRDVCLACIHICGGIPPGKPCHALLISQVMASALGPCSPELCLNFEPVSTGDRDYGSLMGLALSVTHAVEPLLGEAAQQQSFENDRESLQLLTAAAHLMQV